MTAPKVGDTVHVRGVVACGPDHDGKVTVTFRNTHGSWQAVVGDIVHVEPRALAVGDRVTFEVSLAGRKPWEKQTRTIPATIIALHKDNAWLDVDGRFDQVQPLRDLVRA